MHLPSDFAMASNEVRFGYLLLARDNCSRPYEIRALCDQLYGNMLKCVEDAGVCYSSNVNHHGLKIAYFQLLSNSQIVKALHIATSCQLEAIP